MDEARFWELVDQANEAAQGDMEAKCDLIAEAVAALTPDEAQAFGELFDDAMDRAYSWALWGAAYVIGGGCSDDGFIDFRSVLISLGEAVFERALAEPESLAELDLDEDTWFFEGFQYAVLDAVEDVLGHTMVRNKPAVEEPIGEPWDEDEVYDRYPRLADKYGG